MRMSGGSAALTAALKEEIIQACAMLNETMRFREIIRHGLELGVNFYDTAIACQSGTSEQYVSRALRDFVQRDKGMRAT